MQTKTQFSRGSFSTFLSRAASNVDNPLPPTVIASRAAEKLLKDFDILVQPDDLTYDEGCAFKGDFDVNQVREKISAFIRKENLDWDLEKVFKKFCSELDEECREINLKRAFPAGMPFINMDGDKVDLIISCGDNYIARVPMERMTINKYLELKDPSKNKLKSGEISNHSWREDVVAYLKDVKCKNSDEQREVDNLIDSLSGTTLSLDDINKQLYRYFNRLEDKSVFPIIKSGKICLVKAEKKSVEGYLTNYIISDAPDDDFIKKYGIDCVMAVDKHNGKIDLRKEDLD